MTTIKRVRIPKADDSADRIQDAREAGVQSFRAWDQSGRRPISQPRIAMRALCPYKPDDPCFVEFCAAWIVAAKDLDRWHGSRRCAIVRRVRPSIVEVVYGDGSLAQIDARRLRGLAA